jgi:hypothetical protein
MAPGHWGRENWRHWVFDGAVGEDASRARVAHRAQNRAGLGHLARNVLKNERPVQAGGQTNRLQAGGNDAYGLRVLAGLL